MILVQDVPAKMGRKGGVGDGEHGHLVDGTPHHHSRGGHHPCEGHKGHTILLCLGVGRQNRKLVGLIQGCSQPGKGEVISSLFPMGSVRVHVGVDIGEG